MKKKCALLLISVFAVCFLFAEEPEQSERTGWVMDDFNTSSSADPSSLKYFKYYDALPDKVNIKLFDKLNAPDFEGKRLFVGYGTVDPTGENCRVFTALETGQENNMTICLPWWRIERVYDLNNSSIVDNIDFLSAIPEPHPPILVNVCKEWEEGAIYPGGKVTCTSYYDKNKNSDCYDNPIQDKCKLTNCADVLREQCEYIEAVAGDVTTLPNVEYDAGVPANKTGIYDLISHQFECPSGAIVPHTQCNVEISALMYPYECEAPTDNNKKGVYVYCDETAPQYNPDGSLLGFIGQCPSGANIMCEVNTINETRRTCIEPIVEMSPSATVQTKDVSRTYTVQTVDVLSGETDIYAEDPNSVRANTIEESRDEQVAIHIVGDGFLDDDIWIFAHSADGTKEKIYCNMQHNENHGSRKNYDGTIEQCIDNNGAYTFDETLNVYSNDVVSIQQASENENSSGTPFALGRTHYGSTKVVIDGVVAAPETTSSMFPYYPNDGKWMKTWDNALSTLSLMFPYAGAYSIAFYNKNDEEVAKAVIGISDFKAIPYQGNLQLKLVNSMQIHQSHTDETLICSNDDWVEWGGGVYSGKGSKDGSPCYSPEDEFVKSSAVYTVVVQDLFTGVNTRIPLVYPLPYPNRVYVSKLNVYERRKYHVYDPFPTITF